MSEGGINVYVRYFIVKNFDVCRFLKGLEGKGGWLVDD